MRYDFECDDCECVKAVYSRPFSPPMAPWCCDRQMRRIFGCQIDTSGCKDVDDIPVRSRVSQYDHGVTAAKGAKIEAKYAADIAAKRSANRAMRNSTKFRMTHSIPTELYWGKIRQTSDKAYWKDSKNLARHKSVKVG